MSDQEQAAMAAMLEEVTTAAPLIGAREALDAALLEDAEFGRQQTRLKGERERLRTQWRGAQAAKQGSMDERIAEEARALRQDLERQAEAWQTRWEVWQEQRKAQSLRLLTATHSFRELSQQAEDALARLRHAVRTLEAWHQRNPVRPFDRMELQADIERYVSRLADLIGQGEAQALADDPTRSPSWRL